RLGECGHEGDLKAVAGDAVDLGAFGDDCRGVGELLTVQGERVPGRGGDLQRIGDVPDADSGVAGGGAGGVGGGVDDQCDADQPEHRPHQNEGGGEEGNLLQH